MLIMKKALTAFILFSCTILSAQTGYEIKVTFKPFKNQYIYLGHYFGKTYPVIDSAKLDEQSTAVFKGDKKLQGGIYLIGYPNKAGFFEILVDKDQHFTIEADTATIKDEIRFSGSTDNTLFREYQKEMGKKGGKITELQQQLKTAKGGKDSAAIRGKITKLDDEIADYRNNLIKNNPNYILSTFLSVMKDPVLPEKLRHPKTKEDTVAAYNYYRAHYWDDVNFWDGRLAYTTFFEDKLDKYIAQVALPNPDSVIKDLDWMLGYATASEEMTRFLLIKFVNRYLNQKYMWEDAVFVHLFEKYFSQKNYSWLTDQGRKTITDRAYSLMANILGNQAYNIELPDSTGAIRQLFNVNGAYTVVVFWDPTCGHCKEVLPALDSFYHASWKKSGLQLFAIAKETSGTKADWTKFISEHHLSEWTHVYYSKEDDKARTDNGIPGYSQLYDVQSFPTLYLLDKDKRIIAKKLTHQQTDEVLQLKLRGE